MPADFPTSITAIPRVAPTDHQDTPGKEGDVLHNKTCDEIEALQTKVGIDFSIDTDSLDYLLRNHDHAGGDGDGGQIDYASLSSLPSLGTAAALDAGTSAGDLVQLDGSARLPAVDGSLLTGLAPGGVTDHGALTGLADDDHTQYPLSAGRSGGQTLIGGTAADDGLLLQGTSASGTTPSSNALTVRSGDAGSTVALTVSHAAGVAVGPNSAGATLTVGPAPGVSASATALGVGNNAGEFWELASASDPSISYAKVGIGGTSVDPSLHAYGIGCTLFADNTADNSMRFTSGIFGVQSKQSNVGTLSSLRGFSAMARHTAPGALSTMYGFLATAYNYSGATVSTQYGAFLGCYNYLNGAVTNQIGAYVNCEGSASGSMGSIYGLSVRLKVGSGGTATNAYGLSLGGSSAWTASGGTLTNCYGIHIAASTAMGTNKWAIWSASTAQSYLEGALGLGVTAPSAKVHALSTTEQLRLGYDATKYLSVTVSSAGVPTFTAIGAALVFNGDIRLEKTITAPGTTGARTINKTAGSVNFAAGAASLVVTNSLVSTNSVIVATVAANDATLKSVSVVAAAGSFTLQGNAAATAETRVNFIVIN